MTKKQQWVPEIFYEEEDEAGLTSHIPFIAVPEDEEMPRMLFIFESRETGEFEPGPNGEELPVTELTLAQYANTETLKNKLDPKAYDDVRLALGLQPLQQATAAGKKITENIRAAVSGV
tara:strand:- start:248 stop:604 length:357 start_codon:yes stop_codon:yes gene_type:complete